GRRPTARTADRRGRGPPRHGCSTEKHRPAARPTRRRGRWSRPHRRCSWQSPRVPRLAPSPAERSTALAPSIAVTPPQGSQQPSAASVACDFEVIWRPLSVLVLFPALRCLVVAFMGADPLVASRGLLELPERRLGLQPIDQEFTGLEGCFAMR